jgi:uncharacterized membrane protein YsdA (DUF1294 family)/cold shock CspA family protein
VREQGRLTDWDDERGFGYITPLAGGVTVFAHISQFPRYKRRPEVLDLVTYVLAQDDRGRHQAHEVQFMAPTRGRSGRKGDVRSAPQTGEHVAHDQGPAHPSSTVPGLASACTMAAVSAVVSKSWQLPAFYLAMSAVTFSAYGFDKMAAERGARRTSEYALHMLALAGGWPGALVAQAYFRHKTRKQPFRTVFWFTVGANVTLLTLVAASWRG